MASTFRVDAVTGLYNALVAYAAATATAGINGTALLASVWKGRPSTYRDFPQAFIFGRNEDIHNEGTVNTSQMQLSFALVDVISDNLETQARMDVLVDGIRQMLYDLQGHLTNATAFSDISIRNDELRIEGVIYRVEYITLRDLTILERGL
jgi:hypothetical protein